MRYIITTATVVALIVGIALGFVVSRSLDGSASAAPAETKVREQNLDGSGLIRVHEQGTANVSGTVDVGNLPSVQDVNVVSTPLQAGRLVTLTFTNGFSQFVDTSDCSAISVLARDSTDIGPILLFASPDGTARIRWGSPTSVASSGVDGFSTQSVHNLPLAEPFMQVQITVAPNPSGWIWCAP